jgi:DNA-directed RNA polymerase subunit RPC12/RpoP
MKQVLVGLAMVALTALYFWLVARRRYKCPFCGRNVKWNDVNCPYCGNDMQFKHRAGPEAIPRAAAQLKRPQRSSSASRRP